MSERELQKEMKQKEGTEGNDIKSPPCKRRSFVTPITSNQITCCFCRETDAEENLIAAGTLHASKTKAGATHVKTLTETWIEMTKCLEDEYLLVMLAHGDIASNELFYHKPNVKCCYQKYRKRYLKRLKEIKFNNDQNSEDWLKIYSLNKTIYFIKHKENEIPGTVFEVKLLENIYIDILRFSTSVWKAT